MPTDTQPTDFSVADLSATDLSTTDIATRYGKVAVVMGGWSAEREISLRSGAEVLKALRAMGVDAHEVDATRKIAETLKHGGFDRAFLILHGRGGEDGHVQGALELAGIPYTGSDVLGSALAMDKIRSKQVCRAAGVRTADWFAVSSVEQATAAATELGFPVIVKPVAEGSSIGVSKAMQNEVADAFELAQQYGDVMMEKFIDGVEVTAAVVADRSLPLVSMATPNLFYDYDAKYFSDHTEYTCPIDMPEPRQQHIREIALKVFRAIGARDWGRVDFILDSQGKEYFMELNTAPGMTDHSLVPMAALAVGVPFEQLCLNLLELTMGRGVSKPVAATGELEEHAC